MWCSAPDLRHQNVHALRHEACGEEHAGGVQQAQNPKRSPAGDERGQHHEEPGTREYCVLFAFHLTGAVSSIIVTVFFRTCLSAVCNKNARHRQQSRFRIHGAGVHEGWGSAESNHPKQVPAGTERQAVLPPDVPRCEVSARQR